MFLLSIYCTSVQEKSKEKKKLCINLLCLIPSEKLYSALKKLRKRNIMMMVILCQKFRVTKNW